MLGLPKRKHRRILLLIVAAPLFCVVWYLVVRIASPWNAVRIRTNPAAASKTDSESPNQLRIGAYNIAHGRGSGDDNWNGETRQQREQRLQHIASFLKDANLDVVVLNEVDFDSSWSHRVNQAEFIARKAGYRHWAEQRNLDLAIPFFSLRFGNAVLSRYPISAADLIDYPSYAAWEAVLAGKKRGIVCTLELPSNTAIRIVGVHLSHRSELLRIESAKMIDGLRLESGGPIIAAGDFNSTLPELPLAQTDASGNSALSLLLEKRDFQAILPTRPADTPFTYSTMNPDRTIDWILATPPCRLSDQQVLSSKLSDHLPIVATIVINPNK